MYSLVLNFDGTLLIRVLADIGLGTVLSCNIIYYTLSADNVLSHLSVHCIEKHTSLFM
jgi:hypothetical protein